MSFPAARWRCQLIGRGRGPRAGLGASLAAAGAQLSGKNWGGCCGEISYRSLGGAAGPRSALTAADLAGPREGVPPLRCPLPSPAPRAGRLPPRPLSSPAHPAPPAPPLAALPPVPGRPTLGLAPGARERIRPRAAARGRGQTRRRGGCSGWVPALPHVARGLGPCGLGKGVTSLSLSASSVNQGTS